MSPDVEAYVIAMTLNPVLTRESLVPVLPRPQSYEGFTHADITLELATPRSNICFSMLFGFGTEAAHELIAQFDNLWSDHV